MTLDVMANLNVGNKIRVSLTVHISLWEYFRYFGISQGIVWVIYGHESTEKSREPKPNLNLPFWVSIVLSQTQYLINYLRKVAVRLQRDTQLA